MRAGGVLAVRELFETSGAFRVGFFPGATNLVMSFGRILGNSVFTNVTSVPTMFSWSTSYPDIPALRLTTKRPP